MTQFGTSSDNGGFKAAYEGKNAKRVPHGAIFPANSHNRISISKITIPKCERALPRARLFHRLDAYRSFPVTWISAPAGSGKTTLVVSYLAHNGHPAVWYRLDDGDADIATFFYYMGLAAQKAAPRKRKPLPLFTPAYFQGLSAFTLRYFEHLYGRLKTSTILVFDNYQQVADPSEFHAVMAAGLDILPEEVRVIVVSREQPPPQFARLRVNGKIAILEADELFFSLDESREMMRLKVPGGLTEEALARVYEQAGGWAAGLVLMAESVPREDSCGLKPADHAWQELFEYFAAEIFEQMDRETQDFLLKTAFLSAMTAGMADQLTGGSRSADLLARLHRNHFFTEKTTQASPVYRYHPLFKEFLLSRAAAAMSAADLRQIRRSSAVLLAQSGRIEDAAELYLAAGEWQEMIGLILEHARWLVTQGRSQTLEMWLDKLPGHGADHTPWLLYWRGVCRIARDPGRSRADFETAFHEFRRVDDLAGTLLAWSGVVDSILFAWDDFMILDPWIEWFDRLMKDEPQFPSPDIEARVRSSMAGALGMRCPFRPGIRELVERALSLSRQIGDVNLHLTTMHNAALYYVWTGDFAALELLSRRTREVVKSADDSLAGLLFWSSAEPIRKEVAPDHYDQVIPVVLQGLELAGKIGIHVFDYWFYAHGVYGAFNIMDMAKAGDFLQQMAVIAERGPRQACSKYHYLLGWYHFLQGHIPNAMAAVEKALTTVLETGISVPEIPCRQLMAILLQATGDHVSALEQIQAAGKLAAGLEKEGFYHWFCLVTEARLRLEQADQERGMECLRKAMVLGRRRGYMTLVFCWQPWVMADLCKTALEAEIETDYVRNFIRAYRLFPSVPPTECDNWPWPIQIRTLGGFAIVRQGQPLEFKSKAPRKIILLLKAIIAFGAHGADEGQLADLLWPDADGDTARKSIHTSLHRLRQLLGNEKALQLRDGRITLNPAYCRVDAHAFEDLLERAESGSTEARIQQLGKAVTVFKGAFLEGADEPWALSYRERLRNKYLRAVLRLGGHLEQAELFEKAVELYRTALEIENLAEELYRHMILALHASGRETEAVAIFRRCETMLLATLGVGPSPATINLYKELIARQTP